MNWTTLPALLLLTALGSTGARAQAPVPSGYQPRPAVSPYINLLRGGNSPAINYYGIVRPQIEFRNSIGALQQQVDTLQAAPTGPGGEPGLPGTGHPVQFMNYSRYFPLNPIPGASGARSSRNAGIPTTSGMNRGPQASGSYRPR